MAKRLEVHPDDAEILVGLAQSCSGAGSLSLREIYVSRARQLAPMSARHAIC